MDERCSQIPKKIESSRNLTNPQYTLKSVKKNFFFTNFVAITHMYLGVHSQKMYF